MTPLTWPDVAAVTALCATALGFLYLLVRGFR